MHHKDHNHDNNPPDGSNWELLCLYCHDNEHSRQRWSWRHRETPRRVAIQGRQGRISRSPSCSERKSWFAHRGAFHHCLLLRAELDSRFDEQLFHQHGLEINRKFNRHVRRVGGWNALPCCDSGFQNRAHHRLCSNPVLADARCPMPGLLDNPLPGRPGVLCRLHQSRQMPAHKHINQH